MSLLGDLLRQQGDREVEVSIREIPEVLEPGKPKEAQTRHLELVFYLKQSKTEIKTLIARITPEKREINPRYNKRLDLNYFSRDELIHVQSGPEIDMLSRILLYHLVKLDPRISRRAEEPVIAITRIGNRPFNLEELRDIYERVQEARKDRTRKGQRLREFLGWEYCKV